ncbi:hypothetical protein J4E85_009194 [Alternaria conjuncta]|uniref:uncharacterized protein n=1 Tax=Alternaria conjuncta TaxID=181017 RepID=UPI00221F002C|nr:uncharacterized protein J4E85_009194 [Alternaria conjuncta]KAI4920427.1 hypothetical protein J4E85_009194 [Alternaria conjuncta]
MPRQPVHNVVEEKTSGYITKEKLEIFLHDRFPDVSPMDEFAIVEKRKKWEFYAPEEVPETALRALKKKNV